ncbi:MAG: DUF1761 domain-containing protein [Planctomycetota bacterium]
MPEINIWAVLAAAVASFILGGLWYSALFSAIWEREVWGDIAPEQRPKPKPPAIVFGLSFVLAFIAAFVFAVFLGPQPSLGLGVGAGAAAGICWISASFGINYLFSARSLKLWLIDSGYHTLQFTLYGLILGLWH